MLVIISDLHLTDGTSGETIRTNAFGAIKERPWSDPQSQNFTAKIAEINSAILEHNSTALGILKSLTRGSALTLPPATEGGKPAFTSRDKPGSADRVPVKVRMYYLVGNHDWFYHLADPAYTDVRRTVVDALGLTNDPAKPFPHDPK